MAASGPISFVVFASPKSGTEWLRRMLCAHPEVHCAETRPFGDWFDPANPTAPHISLQKYVDILSTFHGSPGRDPDAYARALTARLWRAIAESAREATGKALYGEKITPFDGTAREVVHRLAGFDPELRFIHLVRDGRDVVVSGLAHQRIIHEQKGTSLGAELGEAVRSRSVAKPALERFSSFWDDTCAAGAEARTLFRRFLCIRYEDLLSATGPEMGRVFEFLGATVSPETCADCVRAGEFTAMSGGRTRGEEDLSSVVRKGIAGDWKSWFSPEQTGRFEARCGHWLDLHGYERAARPVNA